MGSSQRVPGSKPGRRNSHPGDSGLLLNHNALAFKPTGQLAVVLRVSNARPLPLKTKALMGCAGGMLGQVEVFDGGGTIEQVRI